MCCRSVECADGPMRGGQGSYVGAVVQGCGVRACVRVCMCVCPARPRGPLPSCPTEDRLPLGRLCVCLHGRSSVYSQHILFWPSRTSVLCSSRPPVYPFHHTYEGSVSKGPRASRMSLRRAAEPWQTPLLEARRNGPVALWRGTGPALPPPLTPTPPHHHIATTPPHLHHIRPLLPPRFYDTGTTAMPILGRPYYAVTTFSEHGYHLSTIPPPQCSTGHRFYDAARRL